MVYSVLTSRCPHLQKELPYSLLSDRKRVLITALGAGEGGKTKRSHFIFEKGGKLVDKRIPVKPVDRSVFVFLSLKACGTELTLDNPLKVRNWPLSSFRHILTNNLFSCTTTDLPLCLLLLCLPFSCYCPGACGDIIVFVYLSLSADTMQSIYVSYYLRPSICRSALFGSFVATRPRIVFFMPFIDPHFCLVPRHWEAMAQSWCLYDLTRDQANH